MPSISYTFKGSIPAPAERVFQLLTDPAQIPQWLPGCLAVEPENPLRRGSRIRLRFAGGRAAEFEVVELTAPANFGWIERRGRPGHQLYFNLGFAGGSTLLTIKNVWQATNWKAWLLGKWYRRRDAKRFFDGTVNNLRRMVTG
jgi:uncharacterized protein YndB with AHSA1/START domain